MTDLIRIIGNLGHDPEVKYLPSGDAMVTISVATSRSYTPKGAKQETKITEWHRIVFYRRLAEVVGEYMKKGSAIYVEGHLTTSKWVDDAGVTRYSTQVQGESMQMLGKAPSVDMPNSDESRRQEKRASKASKTTLREEERIPPQAAKQDQDWPKDEDIPF